MADCIQYDTGQWVRHHTDIFLASIDATGKRQLSYDRATPRAILAMLDSLSDLTDDATALLADTSAGSYNNQKRELELQLMRWKDELKQYRQRVMANIDGDPRSIYFCVTAPLLLGWYGNAACDDTNPNQEQQLQPAVATPMKIMNATLCLRSANENASETAADYFDALTNRLLDLSESAADAAAKAAEAATAGLATIAGLKPSSLVLLALLGLGGYIVLTR